MKCTHAFLLLFISLFFNVISHPMPHCSISASLTMNKSVTFSPWGFGNFKKWNQQYKLGSCHFQLCTATLWLQLWDKPTDSWIISFITFQSYVGRSILISANHVNILWTHASFKIQNLCFSCFFCNVVYIWLFYVCSFLKQDRTYYKRSCYRVDEAS